MKPRKFLPWLLAAMVGIALSACSNDPNEPPPDPPVVADNVATAGTEFVYTVDDASSPIAGTTVTIPADAIAAGEVTINVAYEDAAPAALPASAVAEGAVILSKTIVITKDRPGTFDAPVSIKVPYNAAALEAEDVPSVLYYNEGAASYEAVTVTSFDPAAGFVTFQTAHFSKYVVAGIKGLGKLAAGAAPVAGGPQTLDVDTGMRPSADSFFRANAGSYSSPGGNCLGMAAYSDWFYESAKTPLNAGTGLFATYLEGDAAAPSDDITAEELIVRAHAAASSQWSNLLYTQVTSLTNAQTFVAMISAMKLTAKPQLFIFYYNPSWWAQYIQGQDSWGHAVTAYAYDSASKTLRFYDSNLRGDDTAGVFYDPATGFGTLVKQGLYPNEPNVFGADSVASMYSPDDMRALFDGAAAGWNEGQFGKITVDDPVLDPVTRAARIQDHNNVHLAGTVVPVGGQAGSEPDNLDVFVAGSKVTQVALAADGKFDFTLASIPEGTVEILLVANRASATGGVGVRTQSLYGTFTRFKIRTGTVLDNWGFERGTFDFWDSLRYLWGGGGQVTPSDKSVVVTPGTDPIATTIPMVLHGQYAARVNNEDDSFHISRITRDVPVPSDATSFSLSFNWAAVLEDPQHDPEDQPFVFIEVSNPATAEVLYTRRYYTNDPTFPGWQSFRNGAWKAIDWQSVNLTGLERFKGQTLRVIVEGADCALGAHGGYVYYDAEE